jgi:2,4-dienoyl-CoA reductase (NADPH2)
MTTTPFPYLFSPIAIGVLTIPNRIVQLPMGTGLAENGHITDRDAAIQEERARDGVGLIITGAAVVHDTSRFPARILVEAWDEAGVPALRRRVEAVHAHGTRIIGQLLHLGRESPGGQTEAIPLAPSPVPSPRDPGVPHEMSPADVRLIVDGFGRSAVNFKEAGYDGVEIHAAHGYLVAQFLSRASNYRVDAYRGDALEGRMRLLLEIVEEIRSRCGADYPLGVRLSGDEHAPDGIRLEDTLEIVDALQASAPVEYLSITTGMRGSYVKDTTFEEGFALPLAAAVKATVDVPVIVAGRFRFPELAEHAIASGQTDLVGLGRALLADPEWGSKTRDGRVGEIRPCIGFVQDCRRQAGGVACAVNARLGREQEWGPPRRASRPGCVVVAGGGPAGLESARVAAEAGHEVVVFESKSELGGQLRIAAAGPTRGELLDLVPYLERELDRLGVEIRVATPATVDAVRAESPDLFVCATGAIPLQPEFPVESDARVVTVWELLAGEVAELPQTAVVVDDTAGFWHAISAAEYLAERGVTVELLTPGRAVGLAIPEESVANVNRRLGAAGVRLRPLATVTSVDGTTVYFDDGPAATPDRTQAELVVVKTGLRVEDVLVHELAGTVPALVAIGDCAAPRRLNHAVLDANLAVRRFDEGRLTSEARVLA